MITKLINSTHRPTSVKNLDSHCVLDQDLISVHCTTESNSHQLDHNHMVFDDIPAHRCYVPGVVSDDPWLPRVPEFALQLMHPAAWVKHKKTGTVYELTSGGNICGHGYFNNANLMCKQSVYEFKKLYPEFDFIFALNEIQNITKNLPALAVHMGVEQTEQVHAQIIQTLKVDLKRCFKDVMWNAWFSRLSYWTITIILDIPSISDDNVKLLPYVLGDKLNHHGDDLVDQIIKQLDITTVDDFELRARTIKQVVTQWMIDTNLSRVIDRLLTNNAVLYQKILSHHITEEIVSQLDTLIKKAIQNEVN